MSDIVPVQNNQIIRTIDDAERAARAMAASGFFGDTRQASQAIVKIMAGHELGFGPFASMTGVHIIQNKPVLAANLMAAAVKRAGKYNYRVTEMSDRACEIAFYEGKEKVGSSRFTWEDAEKAGLTNKDNWRKFPRNMLFARALSNGQKWYAPDVFSGATVYTPDELGATVDEEGNVIDGHVVESQSPTLSAPAQPAPEMTIQQAMDMVSSDGQRYGDRLDKDLLWVANNPKSPADKAKAAAMILAHRRQHTTPPEPEQPSQRDIDFPA